MTSDCDICDMVAQLRRHYHDVKLLWLGNAAQVDVRNGPNEKWTPLAVGWDMRQALLAAVEKVVKMTKELAETWETNG